MPELYWTAMGRKIVEASLSSGAKEKIVGTRVTEGTGSYAALDAPETALVSFSFDAHSFEEVSCDPWPASDEAITMPYESQMSRLHGELSAVTAQLETANKLLDVMRKHNAEREACISELRARVAELTKEAPEPEWTQPAEVSAMGRPRTQNGFSW